MRFPLKEDGSILVSNDLLVCPIFYYCNQRLTVTMKVYNKSNVFAVGDAISIDGLPDEKLGHTAEIQAKLACSNIRSVLAGSELNEYIPCPESRSVATSCRRSMFELLIRPLCRLLHFIVICLADVQTVRMYCMSLGKYSGSVRFGPITVNGLIAAFLKWGIEW
eukprot:764738-Hanusia_phi.AAC.5